MAFSTTSRSFTNLGNATNDINRTSSGSALTSTLGNGAGPWGNKTSSIWGGGTSTFGQRPIGKENVQGKPETDASDMKLKGSGSLLASSESDAWRPQARGDSAVRLNTTSLRAATNAEPPRSLSSESSTISPTTARAPAVNLTNTTFSQARPPFQSSQSSGFFGEQPPNVYPKYRDRQPPVETISPVSTSHSPVDTRRPQWPATYRDTISHPGSRDHSRPPTSSHSDRQWTLPGSDYSRTFQYSTPATARTQSISSQRNGSLTSFGAINPDFLPSAFSHLSLQHTRPNFSRGSDVRYQNDVSRVDHYDEFDRCGANQQGFSNLDSQLLTGAPRGQFSFSASRLHDPQAYEFRPGQNFQFHDSRRFEELNAVKTLTPHDLIDSSMAMSRRSPVSQQQHLFDQHSFAFQVQALKDQYSLWPYGLPNTNGITPYLGYYPMSLNGLPNALPQPPLELEGGVQSAKLYEFKIAGKNNRRYELKDIYDHIAEFAGDQHGSRFIQNKLETANSDEKERVFREIEPNAIPLMTDVFGNYVIQKFFDHGHQEHKKILANKMRGQVLNLSLQMYGCRVVQKALEHVLLEQQASLVGELENHVIKCVKDQNGNHVIQKAIERCPTETIGFVYQAFIGQVYTLSLHPYGCRVIQRCLERQERYPAKTQILAELYDSMPKGMIGDSYGNYVVQHVVENGPEPDRLHVLGIVLKDLEGYSKHKFASNVVEKCIQYSNDAWRRRVVEILTMADNRRLESEGVLVGLIKDSFGNYVIQKLLDSLSPQDFVHFHQHLQPAMAHTKRMGAGKQVVSIEKKMQRFESMALRGPAFQLTIPTPAFQSSYGSMSNTPPPLTADTHSMQSSGLPSINGDAIEGATCMSRKGSEAPLDGMMLR